MKVARFRHSLLAMALVLSSLLSPGAHANDDSREAEIQSLYQTLRLDFLNNPYFSVRMLNADRDGRESPYLAHYGLARFNNALPLSDAALSRLMPFRMLSYPAFHEAYLRLEHFKHSSSLKKPSVLTVIDFDQPVYARRLFVLDLARGRVLFNTYVAHGSGSDPANTGWVRSVGDRFGSNKTALGAYVTLGSMGHAGKHRAFTDWLEVKGLERRNSNAYRRGILFHENIDLSESFMSLPAAQRNYVRTQGCFGISQEESGRFYGLADQPLDLLILKTIQGGSFVYAYSSRYR